MKRGIITRQMAKAVCLVLFGILIKLPYIDQYAVHIADFTRNPK